MRSAPKSVILLMDTSGSMAGSKLQEAKRACHVFIDQTDLEAVEVGVVSFGDDGVNKAQDLCCQAETLKKKVDALTAGGSTPMAEGIELGTGMLDNITERARFLVLFTDGEPDSRDAARGAAQAAKGGGIQIICIGVPGANTALLEQMASSSEQSFFAKDGNQLTTTFGNIARRISGGLLKSV